MTDFSVVAIIAAYNEADLIGHVVGDLIDQGLQVYFLDDGSTDNTIAAVEPFLGRGVLGIERLTEPGAGGEAAAFDWERILRRKSELARELDADWFLHHDADEFRESPWSHATLVDAIRRVDALGFNAIDFASLDFWPVHDRFRPGDDVRGALTFYTKGAPYDRLQIRGWKKAHDVDLVSTGGHEARFAGRKVFPIRFISRHYPIRGQAHGERKVLSERRNRFLERERARGWHVQYDAVSEGASFIRDPSTLEPYDPDAVRLALMLRHRGVEALETSLAAEQSAAASLRRELDAREQDVRRTAGALARTEETLARTEDTLARNEQTLAQTRDTLAHTQNTLAETRNTLAQTQHTLAQTQNALAQTQNALARTEEAFAAKTADVAALRSALEQRVTEIGQWRSSVDDCTRRLDAFNRSWSWRWTAPARAAYRLLKGS